MRLPSLFDALSSLQTFTVRNKYDSRLQFILLYCIMQPLWIKVKKLDSLYRRFK
ncbi:g454 [Yersinia phage fHe-Yen9-04]|uniref:G454 protein n=1 Tax=Yersinia phage fHe-Yen9-04 TaxID=2052742 RepID=A0A2C9CY17_9CAUD|nr:hypothetical protein FDJ41_gp449 [Yersinia phage fHe-Yen9-04]SOK58731.1 g454 [Yersinia phage fHe-Yen9-04]VUE36500.1 g454 [Yersinia phage fHe-Yen9-04]